MPAVASRTSWAWAWCSPLAAGLISRSVSCDARPQAVVVGRIGGDLGVEPRGGSAVRNQDGRCDAACWSSVMLVADDLARLSQRHDGSPPRRQRRADGEHEIHGADVCRGVILIPIAVIGARRRSTRRGSFTRRLPCSGTGDRRPARRLNPYVTNTIRHDNPLYIAVGKGSVDPAELLMAIENRRALPSASRCRRASASPAARNPHVCLPLLASTSEWSVFRSRTVPTGGFGPLFLRGAPRRFALRRGRWRGALAVRGLNPAGRLSC